MITKRAIAWTAITIALCAVVGVVAAVRRASPVSTESEIPTGRVKRGDFETNVYARGELRASHFETLAAPPIGGGSLQITQLLQTGTSVKKGDLVMEFDPAEQLYKLAQNRSELLQAEQEITKAQADAAVQAAQDKVTLLKARFDVRRAELDVQKNEIVSTIDGRKNDLALEGAKRVLAEVEQDVKSRSASNQASIALAQEKHNKAKLAMDQAQQNIGKMRVVAPIDGLVALEKNQAASGGIFFGGMSLPEFRAGDQVEAGTNVARVIDPTNMELVGKVGELERNRIRVDESVEIRLDALPQETLQGTIKALGGMNNKMFWETASSASYEFTLAITSKDPRLRPGLTAQLVINGNTQKNVLSVPRHSLFLKDGKRVVYVREGARYESHEAKVLAENESRAAVEGLDANTEIALIDPTAPKKATNHAGSALPGGGAP